MVKEITSKDAGSMYVQAASETDSHRTIASPPPAHSHDNRVKWLFYNYSLYNKN